MSKLWAKDDQGTLKDGFTKDSDTFQLSENILELCMIWKWRAQKGLPYAQDQDNYEDAKEKLQAADKGSRIISVGRARRLRGMKLPNLSRSPVALLAPRPRPWPRAWAPATTLSLPGLLTAA